MPSLEHLPADAAIADICDLVTRDGALIIDGLMSKEHLTQLKTEIMPYVEATDCGRDDFTGRRTTRTGALVARSPACRDLVTNTSILDATERFLAPFCNRVQLHLTQLIRIGPGEKAQVLHRDRLAWGGFLQRSIEPQLNTIWAVTDFTEENGATRVVPGSNTWSNDRTAEPHEIGYAEMEAGSVLVYSGSVIHSGGANQSKADRMGLNITYSLGWLRQEENQYLSCPPHIAKDLPEELRALLGYSMGSYALGYYTPPGAPGEGPEVVPPEHLFSGKAAGWGEDLYAATSARATADTA